MPRLLLFGDFWPDRLGASYQRALTALGVEVTGCDTRSLELLLPHWARTRVIHRATRHSLVARRAASRAYNERVLEIAREVRPDLALILNGDFLMPATLGALRSMGSRVFIFHADNPFAPHYAHRPESLPGARMSDCYFIWSRVLADGLRAIGTPQTEYLPFAWDPDVFPYAPTRGDPKHSVVFIGGWDREREELLEIVAKHFPLKIWGPPYWGTRSRPRSLVRDAWQGRAATQGEAARISQQSKVSLNILRTQNLPDGTNMRTFELPGCGGTALASRSSGAEEIFPEGRAAAYFASPDECCQQIAALLDDEPRRRAVAAEAHAIVERGHRYVHRAARILDIYRGLTGDSPTLPAVRSTESVRP